MFTQRRFILSLPFNLNDLPVFIAVAESGSLSAAARRLGMAQPTVGRRIRQLEAALGVRLFDRTPDGHRLTAAAENILAAALRTQENASAVAAASTSDERLPSGVVRITTSEGLANAWLMQRLLSFRQRYPALRVEVIVSTALLDLRRLDADVALRIGTPGSVDLVGREIGRVAFGLYASAAYLQRCGEPATLKALAGHRIIESSGALADVRQAQQLRSDARGARVVFASDSLVTQVAAAGAGMGIAAVSGYMAAQDRRLQRILTDEFEVQLPLWLLTHRDLRGAARVRALMEFLQAEAENDPNLLPLLDPSAHR